MKTTTDYPAWCHGIIAKRSPDALAVLADLLRAGLANGECTANDVAQRNLQESNIIGGVFKLLPSVGFRQTGERVKPNAKCKHGRLLFLWKLTERWKAERFLNMVTRAILPEDDKPGQQLLRM